MEKINLLNFSRSQMKDFFLEIGEKSFRADQCIKWIHQFGVTDFALMTNFGKALREKLAQKAEIKLPKLILNNRSKDGTTKFLIQLDGGSCIETVYIPEKSRGTLCVSSQIGCGLTCSFCSTAKQGFNRNLKTAEIIAQVFLANQALKKDNDDSRIITNVVMMGMGEPLLNYDPVVSAMDLMMDDYAYGLSKRRVTLSTSGLVPQMEKLKNDSDVALAVSLHAPNDELRNELVPINRKYPIKQLLESCKHYFDKEPRRKVTFEYVMLKDVNDTLEHAKDLARLVSDIPCKINLIPFNPFPGTQYQRSSNNQIHRFNDYLTSKGLNTIVRKTRGDDIDAACGQLAGKVNDKTKRSERWRDKISPKLVVVNEERV